MASVTDGERVGQLGGRGTPPRQPYGSGPRPSRGPRLGRTVHSASRPCSVRDWDRFRAGAQGRWRIGRHPVRPVLKHGPRSLTCTRVAGSCETPRRSESEGHPPEGPGGIPRSVGGAPPARLVLVVGEAEQERARWDPKDGELCPSRLKSGETLMEDRSDSDVQIDRQTWV